MNKSQIIAFASIALLMAACVPDQPKAEKSTVTEARAVENNQSRLVKLLPPPLLDTSLERKNLIERLQRINQQNMSGCIYLMSYGTVVAFYPVRGKVTSLNAYLMGDTTYGADPIYSSMRDSVTAVPFEQPDFDGAYGKNADGIFFFTADTDAYVEWSGQYLWSDQCLKPSQQPLMVREVK